MFKLNFIEIKTIAAYIKFNISSKNQQSPLKVPKVLYENRYCNHKDFSILVCAGLIMDQV